MATKELKARIALKHDTEANWTLATNFTPLNGEVIIYDIDATHTTQRIKIGDGTTKVNALPFWQPEGSGGASDYNDLDNKPISLVEESFNAEDAIGTGTFMGQTYKKVSTDYLDVNRLIGASVDGTAYDSNHVIDITETLKSVAGTDVDCTVISVSGNATNFDYLVVSVNDALVLAGYGINLTKGTYIAPTVTTLELLPVVVIDPDYAGNFLPTVNELSDGKTMEVIGGTWVVGAKNSLSGIEDWSRFQRVLRSNYAEAILPLWSQVRVPHKKYGNITFDVVAHNVDLDPEDSTRHTITLYMRDCIAGIQYDANEALCVCPSGLAAGTYHADNNKSWTLTEAVPADGVLVFVLDVAQWEVVAISSYASLTATTPIETVQLVDDDTSGTDITEAVDASNVNHIDRACYGSNNWYQSAIRQWLNATGAGGTWWTAQTKFDRPPSYVNEDGFLAGFPADFVSALVATDQVTNTNKVYEIDFSLSTNDTHVTYTTTDKMFLASWTQLHGVQWSNQVDENTLWTAFTESPESDTPDREKTDLATRQIPYWYWMRSCDPDSSYFVRVVSTGGYASNLDYAAVPVGGAAAACVIGAI